jgi:transposase
MNIASIGIDLGKTTFHLVALGERNKILLRKKFSRSQLLAYTANLPASLIGLEACAGAHFVGTALREQGHQVRLIPAQFVKPYRKSNKNDFLDAEAIAEAVPVEQRKLQQASNKKAEQGERLFKILPDIFVFGYAGCEGDLIKLSFRPNRNFRPPSIEARVFKTWKGR